jgi:formylglycine-generating enzyme required for sulfatase activity
LDDQIRAIEEHVYAKYVEPSRHGLLDEEAAVRVLEQFYARPDQAENPDCYLAGVLCFELGYAQPEQQVEYFRRAKRWLERHRTLTGEAWEAVDDRLADIDAFLAEQGDAPAPPAPVIAPHGPPQTTEDHGTMVLVPAGPFLFGSEGHAANLVSFWIDKYPVTNRQYEAFCRATGYRWPKYWEDSRFNNPDAPVVGVSVADAQKYSRWVGKTLPSEEQWEKACRGTDGRLYPWGNREPTDALACHGRDPVTGGTDPVNARESSASPYGAVDLSGNCWEWTSTAIEDTEPLHVIKGGCYNDPPGLLRAFVRLEATPKDKYETIGFRCVKSA